MGWSSVVRRATVGVRLLAMRSAQCVDGFHDQGPGVGAVHGHRPADRTRGGTCACRKAPDAGATVSRWSRVGRLFLPLQGRPPHEPRPLPHPCTGSSGFNRLSPEGLRRHQEESRGHRVGTSCGYHRSAHPACAPADIQDRDAARDVFWRLRLTQPQMGRPRLCRRPRGLGSRLSLVHRVLRLPAQGRRGLRRQAPPLESGTRDRLVHERPR